ncbi:VP1 [Philantomba monticola polyomavirus 1]|uniref:VP1 n=1 Tax=Philantomba monticola polyomavirus 1 TaxID=2170411 RepID=A0A2S1CJK0_9POLY|nr:VP1 [Philantomba monticola polyomavirus 1]AWD33736.1 VP1 [Philantomba monticola polyomavirus 1]
MAPPKKRVRCVAEKVKCPPTQKPKTCPVAAPVPKLLIKGGVEVLNVETGPDAYTEIELFLNPRMGFNNPKGDKSTWYGWSEVIHHGDGNEQNLLSSQLPQYSCARVQLPLLNEDMTCNTLRMWEAVSCKTEVVGIGSLIDIHIPEAKHAETYGITYPVQGLNYHMFAVGGEPLDLQGIEMNGDTLYAVGNPRLTVHPNDITNFPVKDKHQLQGLIPKAKAKLDKDGFYPVEEWSPDPSRNENSRYFGSFVGGISSPPTLQFTNSVTTVLLDENGVGPLCKGDGLFVSCADICGIMIKNDNGGARFRGLPRYFKVTLRKRVVRNPYPISSLLGSLFSDLMPKLDGQPMSGQDAQVEEVRVYEGKEGLPADPDVRRYIDQFGQEKTQPPAPGAVATPYYITELLKKKYPYLLEEKEESKTPEDLEESPTLPEASATTAATTEEITEHNLITEDYTSKEPEPPAMFGGRRTVELKGESGESLR